MSETLLARYAGTTQWRLLQGLPGVADLVKRGLVEWRGSQFGTQFYCITEAGRAAIQRATEK
jgi:hypothetical protein